jgi:hypothetical protein
MHPLESRQLLGAPITLASEGLVLAGPTSPGDLLGVESETAPSSEPTAAAGPAATQPVAAPTLAPEEDPLSPAGDPKKGAAKPAPVLTTLSGSTYTVDVWMDTPQGNTDVFEYGQTSGFFRFHAAACGSFVAASSVTVNYTRSGAAYPTDDYSGALADSTSVTIPLSGTDTNKSGTVDVGFTAVDDTLEEPQTPESVNVAISDATDNNGQAARVGLFGTTEEFGTVESNDYHVIVLTTADERVLHRSEPVHVPKAIKLQLIKDNVTAKNGVDYYVTAIQTGEPLASTDVITADPHTETTAGTTQPETIAGVPKDGIATIYVDINPNSQVTGDKDVFVKVKFTPRDATQPVEVSVKVFVRA